jgi:microcystin-dependent protein
MEGTIAEVKYFAGNFAPRSWAFCQGQMMPIAQWQTLFSVLGTTYGGDGRTTFALPKIEDLNGCKAIICLDGVYPSRS